MTGLSVLLVLGAVLACAYVRVDIRRSSALPLRPECNE